LANIAFTCHFSSQANFSRAFLSATGFTPGRYRRTYQPNPRP
jgi:AraC-like DNA-binding protein